MEQIGYVRARDVADAAAAQDLRFERLQAAVGQLVPPAPPSGVQQIDVNRRRIERDAVDDGAIRKKRDIEALSVEREPERSPVLGLHD